MPAATLKIDKKVLDDNLNQINPSRGDGTPLRKPAMDDILHFTSHLGVDSTTCEAHLNGYQETILLYEKEFTHKNRESYNLYFTSEFTHPVGLSKKLASIRMEYEEKVNKVKHRMCMLLIHMVENGTHRMERWSDRTDEFNVWIEQMMDSTRDETWCSLYDLSVSKRQEAVQRREAEEEEVEVD